jgi:nucleoside-diphosphate-sugar epimerase
MKILLTGAEGYIGSVAGPYLQSRGFHVIGLDAGFFKNCLIFDTPKKTPPIIHKDTRHLQVSDLEGYDAIVHMAELSNDPLAESDPEITYEINHHATVRLAKLAKKAGVRRFVDMSSCSIYGVAHANEVMDETSVVNPQTPYAKCKYLVEQDLKKLADNTFSPVFLRNATVFGSSPRLRLDLVLNRLTVKAYSSRVIHLDSDGSPWRPIVHIEDVAEAIALSLLAPISDIHNQVFNVGSNSQVYQVRDIAQIVAKVFTDRQIVFGSASADNRSYRVNFDKIHKILGYNTRFTARDGVVQLKTLFDVVGIGGDLLDSKNFTRLKYLKYLQQSKKVTKSLFWILS